MNKNTLAIANTKVLAWPIQRPLYQPTIPVAVVDSLFRADRLEPRVLQSLAVRLRVVRQVLLQAIELVPWVGGLVCHHQLGVKGRNYAQKYNNTRIRCHRSSWSATGVGDHVMLNVRLGPLKG